MRNPRPEVASRFKRVFNEVGLGLFDRAIELESQAQRALGQGSSGHQDGRADGAA